MAKDFILITGHGIFPTDSILQVVPVTDVSFEILLTAPTDEDSKFVISVIKSVSVNLDIARTNPTKKNDVDTITDYGYSKDTSEQYDFEQDEFLSMLDLSDDETVKGYIKDYGRRLKKYSDYQRAITAIESNPEVPDYEASLAAVKQNAPGSSYVRKQEKTEAKLKDFLLEQFLGAVENASDDDEDYKGKKIIDIINSEDSQDRIEDMANSVLKKFYNKNFDAFGDEDDDLISDDEGSGLDSNYLDNDFREDFEDGEGISEEIQKLTTGHLERADAIRHNPDVISNKETPTVE